MVAASFDQLLLPLSSSAGYRHSQDPTEDLADHFRPGLQHAFVNGSNVAGELTTERVSVPTREDEAGSPPVICGPFHGAAVAKAGRELHARWIQIKMIRSDVCKDIGLGSKITFCVLGKHFQAHEIKPHRPDRRDKGGFLGLVFGFGFVVVSVCQNSHFTHRLGREESPDA